MTRDESTAADIRDLRDGVGDLRDRLAEYGDHAREQDALAHAALYATVEDRLARAQRCLTDAWDVMAKGDPEQFIRNTGKRIIAENREALNKLGDS